MQFDIYYQLRINFGLMVADIGRTYVCLLGRTYICLLGRHIRLHMQARRHMQTQGWISNCGERRRKRSKRLLPGTDASVTAVTSKALTRQLQAAIEALGSSDQSALGSSD